MPAKNQDLRDQHTEALESTIAAQADYAGLVFYPASPVRLRRMSRALTSRATGQIAMVGLFVDADDAVSPTHWG